ncbi:hypothetical protein KAR91_14670 [Candidatus Pacearchaeota archaeon]|nr:hypothetical protein [Candidatus Pacearchaeota archaeon]
MPTKTFPTPSISEESHFHELNALIVKSQQLLCSGTTLKYSEVDRITRSVAHNRKRAKEFNTRFGLSKEIA